MSSPVGETGLSGSYVSLILFVFLPEPLTAAVAAFPRSLTAKEKVVRM